MGIEERAGELAVFGEDGGGASDAFGLRAGDLIACVVWTAGAEGAGEEEDEEGFHD